MNGKRFEMVCIIKFVVRGFYTWLTPLTQIENIYLSFNYLIGLLTNKVN